MITKRNGDIVPDTYYEKLIYNNHEVWQEYKFKMRILKGLSVGFYNDYLRLMNK